MHLAFLYAADFINLHNIENFVLENHDEEVLEDLVAQSEELAIVSNDEFVFPDELETNLLEVLNLIENMH